MTEKPLAFPPLTLDFFAQDWQWPRAPFEWPASQQTSDQTQRCRIETVRGDTVEVELVALDGQGRTARVRPRSSAPTVYMPFGEIRRLTLLDPLYASPLSDAVVRKVPTKALERDYVLESSDPRKDPLTGRAVGHVEMEEGLYLFAAADVDRGLLRIFVPNTAYTECEFGPTAAEITSQRWIANPPKLLEALARQERQPVLPIGQSLLELGLLTREQLYTALSEKPEDTPLGEMLVAQGLITRSNLNTALAHKMGYPLVDLERFPLDPEAARSLTLRTAIEYRALPLMTDGHRLIIAVDRPSRAAKLRDVLSVSTLVVVVVLAPKSHILAALTRLAQLDVWQDHVPVSMGFFSTTAM